MERQKELSLAGKVMIITGASRGIGKQTALAFARRGVNVVFAARTVEPDSVLPGTLGETLKQVEALGVGALGVPADMAKEEDLKRLVAAAVDRFGGVDILINNAAATTGTMWSKSFLELTREEWLYQYDVNLHAPFTLTQLVVPIMERRGGGRILNVSTDCGESRRLPEEPRMLEGLGDYSLDRPGYFSSKRALDRFGSVIAPGLARKNIAVIGMNPGLVSTELLAMQVKTAGLDDSLAVPMTVPARMLIYFASCKDPMEYTGRLFLAAREMADMGIELD